MILGICVHWVTGQLWGVRATPSLSALPSLLGTQTRHSRVTSHLCAGITQEKINEMRAAPEQKMISDIHCMIAAGQDLDWIDGQGATLVRRWVSLVWVGGKYQNQDQLVQN